MSTAKRRPPLITVDGAAALAKERGLTLPTRWWRRQIDSNKLAVTQGVVPYLTLDQVERAIELVAKGQTGKKKFGLGRLEAGQAAEFSELVEPGDVA